MDIYVEQIDTTFNIHQEGSYLTKDTEYIQPIDFGVDHWKSTLEFQPQRDANWEKDFLIYKNQRVILFLNYLNDYLFELPNSGGYVWVSSWRVK